MKENGSVILKWKSFHVKFKAFKYDNNFNLNLGNCFFDILFQILLSIQINKSLFQTMLINVSFHVNFYPYSFFIGENVFYFRTCIKN